MKKQLKKKDLIPINSFEVFVEECACSCVDLCYSGCGNTIYANFNDVYGVPAVNNDFSRYKGGE